MLGNKTPKRVPRGKEMGCQTKGIGFVLAYTIVRFLSRCDLFQALQEKQHGLLERLDELNEECEELREKLSIVEEEKENMEEKWEKEKEANKRRINENDKVRIYLFEKKK